MPAFHLENFGCRAARADAEAVSERLRSAGLAQAPPAHAEVVVVNTCSVTAEADRAARAFIRRAHRANPACRIVITGCYAQRAPEELALLPGVAAVVGNSHKALAPEIALQLAHGDSAKTEESYPHVVSIQSILLRNPDGGLAPIWADDRFAHSFLEEVQLLPGLQTRPNLKIQEGCGNRCTFCVIPQTRGFSKSLSAEAVLRHVHQFVAAGGNELVLSGINLGRWGRDLAPSAETGPAHLPALVRQIFEQTPLRRLRLSSVEPMDWDAELISLMRQFGNEGGRLARHAHLPLQSGSDTVLRRMHRRYRPWHYEEKVWALVEAAGSALTLGADVMAGFPGETDREFDETLAFLRKLPIGYLHLFPFSPRPGTRGWALHAERPVPLQAVDERMAALRSLSFEKSHTHRRSFEGRELDAITLRTPPALSDLGQTAALTENFLPLEVHGSLPPNVLVRVLVNQVRSDGALSADRVVPPAGSPTGFFPEAALPSRAGQT